VALELPALDAVVAEDLLTLLASLRPVHKHQANAALEVLVLPHLLCLLDGRFGRGVLYDEIPLL